MLDDFSLEQKIAYKTMINSQKNNKVSHAYLIEDNGYTKTIDLAISFAKYLLCPFFYSNSKKCENCNQCNNIDKNEFLELKIIEPDGQWIKKSQLDQLQSEFSKKSILGSKKVYIINGAQYLNDSSSNSLLKFLEEPEEGIIAILIVDNIYHVLSTIVSRCQIISLTKINSLDNLSTIEKIARYLNNSDEDIKLYMQDENNVNKILKVIDFINYYEDNNLNTIIYINKLWHDNFKERQEISDMFEIMILFYKDVLNLKLNKKIEIFNDYVNELKKTEEKNTVDILISKINVIINLQEKIKFNINLNMLMDKLIIELERCDLKC